MLTDTRLLSQSETLLQGLLFRALVEAEDKTQPPKKFLKFVDSVNSSTAVFASRLRGYLVLPL